VARLREVGEFEALRRLTAGRAGHPAVVVGPGDDAAVLRPAPGMDLVATTDAFVEGRHYRPEWLDPAGRGARLAAANLSDLAAMAALPRWALLSVGVRAEHEVEALLALEQGLEDALAADGAVVVGGNITATEGPEWLSLTLLGEVAPGRAWTRRGARPGDLIAVSGAPGRAGAGLRLALSLGERARAPEWSALLEAWLRPRSRVALARTIAASGAVTAAIDLSDGLRGDLAHVCEAGGVGAEIDDRAGAEDALLERAAAVLGVPRFDLVAGPSDDYELLLAVDPARRAACELAAAAAGGTLAFVGRFTDDPGAIVRVEPGGSRRPLEAAGFDHFARG
jgi:thiamine-monophosphate kinase